MSKSMARRPRNLPPVPNSATYESALRALEADIHPNKRAMLLALYRAGEMTTDALCNVVGYKSYRGVNLQLGLLGN